MTGRLWRTLVLLGMSVAAVSCVGDDLGVQVAAGGAGGGNDGPMFEPPPFPGLPTNAILPSTSAGSLEGSLDVTPLGSASYTLPIDVPVGRRGMQPSLALTYDSNAGSSWLGVGFAITGLPSSVRRCATPAPPTGGNGQLPSPPSGTPRQLDEGRISYTDDVTASYCWGSERLIRLPSENHLDYEEYRPWTSPNTRVRPERDNNGRVVAWIAELPSGRVLRFEHVVFGTAHVTSDAGVRSAQPGRVIEWALSRELDLYGNTIEYLYDTRRDVDANSYLRHRLSEIRYTGLTDDGETTPGLRSVRFVTQPRPDVMSWRRHGVAMISDERLARVEIHGPDVDGTVRRFWYYRFEYRNDSTTQRSLLRRVLQCDANDVCNPPTRFDWDMGSLAVERSGTGPATGGHHAVADMNGDGFEDLLVGPYQPENLYGGPLRGQTRWRVHDRARSASTRYGFYFAPAVVDLSGHARQQLLAGRYGEARPCSDAVAAPFSETDTSAHCSTVRDYPFTYAWEGRESACVRVDAAALTHGVVPRPFVPGDFTDDEDDDNDFLRCWRMRDILDPDGDEMFFGSQSADGFWFPGLGLESDVLDDAGPGWHSFEVGPVGLVTAERIGGLIHGTQTSGVVLAGLIPGNFVGDDSTEVLMMDPPQAQPWIGTGGVSGFPQLYSGTWSPRLPTGSPADLRGGQFSVHPLVEGSTFTEFATRNLRLGWGPVHSGDFDGDGHVDLLVPLRNASTMDSPISVALPTYGLLTFSGDGRPQLRTTALPAPDMIELGLSAGEPLPDMRVPMDVNGDGLVDIVDPSDVDGAGRTAVYFNESGSFTPAFYLPAAGNTPLVLDERPAAQELRARAIDWDLDGRTDLMILDDNPRVLLSRTTRFLVRPLPFEVGTVRVRPVPTGAAAIATRAPVVFIDITGDGVDDILVGDAAGNYERFVQFVRTAPHPDRLRAVRAPTGAESRVEYATLRDASVGEACWDRSNREVETFSCARATTQVVRRLFEPTDVAGVLDENEHVYAYMMGRRDRGGALLGFERIQHYDSSARATEEVAYRFEEVVHEWFPVRGHFYSEIRVSARQLEEASVVVSATEAHATLTTLRYERRAVTPLGVYRFPSSAREVSSLGLYRELMVGGSARQLRVPRSEWAPPSSGGPLDVLDPFGGPEPDWFSEEDSLAVPNLLGFVEDEVTERRRGTTPVVRTEVHREPFLSAGAYLYGMAEREEVTEHSGPSTGTRVMAYEWNERGAIDAAIREPDRATDDPDHVYLRVETSMDPFGQPSEITALDAEAIRGEPAHHVRVTTVTYDELDGTHLRSVTNTLGQLQWVGMHPTLGVPLVATDANGISGYFRYDGFGRVRETRAPGGATTTYEYRHVAGRDTVTQTDSGGGRGETRMDSLNRPQQFTHRLLGGDFGSTMTYDTLGRAVEATIPRLTTATGPRVSAQRETDAFGRLTRTSFVRRTASGAIAQTVTRWRASYEIGATTATFTDTDSVRFAEADHHGRIVRSGDRREGVEEERSHSYGVFDLPEESRDVIGATTVVRHDDIGRPTYVEDPDRGARTITYNAFGDVVAIEDALGTTAFPRDDLGRKLEERRTVDGVPSTVAIFVWDTATNGIGRIDYAAVPATGDTIEYRYDVAGRVQRETRTIAGEVFETDMAYDSVGRLRRVQYPRANGRRFAVFYRYDPSSGALNRVETCSAGCTGGAAAREGEVLWELRRVDGLGRPLEETRGGMTTTRTYDELRGTLESLTTRNAASTALQQWIYFADDEGRFTARGEVVSPRIELFGYDTFDRLRTWNVLTGPGFLRLRRTDTFDYEPQGGGRFDAVTSQNFWTGTTTRESYAYPEIADGQPHAASEVTRTVGASSVVEGYEYDDLGRQDIGPGRTIDYTHFDLPWRVTTPTGTTTFEYDPFHQRTRSIRPDGVVMHVGEIYERRQNGEIGQHVFYVHTPVGLVAQVEEMEGSASRTTRYFHDDGLRSVSLITNPTGSTVHGRQWFGPFGQRLALDGTDAPPETTTVVRGFTEHRQEDALGLIDMRGRFYDPRLRQFLTPDPLQAHPLSSQGTNPYSYVMNRPPNAWDPTGFITESECFANGRACIEEGLFPEPDEHVDPAGDRADAFRSSFEQSRVAGGVAAGPGESASVGGETLSGESLLAAFRSVAGDRAADIAGAFYDQLLSVQSLWNYAVGVGFGAAQGVPVLNWFVDTFGIGALIYYIYTHGRDLYDRAVRFVEGTDTVQDRQAIGHAIAEILMFSAGAGRARAAVGGAADATAARMMSGRGGPRASRRATRIRMPPPSISSLRGRATILRQELSAAWSYRDHGNIGFARGSINGGSINLTAVSGSATPPGTVGLVPHPRFSTVASGIMRRDTDTESLLLEHIAQGLPRDARGEIYLFTENTPCTSCEGVIFQFQRAFPNIDIFVGTRTEGWVQW